MPGVPAFDEWLGGIERHDAEGRACNAADVAALKALFEATDGTGWTESDGWLSGNTIGKWHGIAADSLGRVSQLDLARNGLTGELPTDLGDLANMTVLRIGGNALTGRLPPSLVRVPLREFRYADTALCVPAERTFRAWLNTIASHESTGDECVPLSDRDILEALYTATDGPNWVNSDNWLTDAPLGEWHGVDVDDQGRVYLSLPGNNLSASIPAELGNLASLAYLSLAQNALTGPIPPELGNLTDLTWLLLNGNQLTGSIPPELGNLADLTRLRLYRNQLTGSIPPELGNLTDLTELLLESNALTGPIPPELGNLTDLTWLWLDHNDLTGPIPPELGNLADLTLLWLGHNFLTGSIPPALGNLANLTGLWLSSNQLTGPIPAELGKLANLTTMWLSNNLFSGPIPPELGNLTSLPGLVLNGNQLTGSIPPALGNLANLTGLWLSHNQLTGPIPPELGNLTNLTALGLSNNRLSGPVPPEFSGMSSLRALSLSFNPALAGPLPTDLTTLDNLVVFLASGTGLCAPTDADFQVWLEGVRKRRIAHCIKGNAPMAYLTQAVQSRTFPVPLVAGEKALLRVFPTAEQATGAHIPGVRAHFYRGDRETHVVDIPPKSTPIPTDVREGSLAKSANVEIPGHVVQPGLEMMIEIDPQGTLDPALGVPTRIPETGHLAVEVREMPLFDLTLIPFIWTQAQDPSMVDLVEAIAADPENHAMLHDARTLLPIGSLEVTAHEPVLSSSNNTYALISQTEAIRAMEGGRGHYMGMMSRPFTGPGGLGTLGGWTSIAGPYPTTIAHEFGHNLGLLHAPCGATQSLDSSYPYRDGSIGVWGYDFEDGGRLVRPSTPDLMSYCRRPHHISDYHFTNALRFRLASDGSGSMAAVAPRAQSLLLWGGIGADSVPFLEPAFVVDARRTLPQSAGEYRLTGRTESGTELFSLSFAMPEVADGDGNSSFAYVLPVRPGWEDSLASVTLIGPSGTAVLDDDSHLPMAILRDPLTGQVRGILRDPPRANEAAADAVGGRARGLEVLFSRGIPGSAAWRR